MECPACASAVFAHGTLPAGDDRPQDRLAAPFPLGHLDDGQLSHGSAVWDVGGCTRAYPAWVGLSGRVCLPALERSAAGTLGRGYGLWFPARGTHRLAHLLSDPAALGPISVEKSAWVMAIGAVGRLGRGAVPCRPGALPLHRGRRPMAHF